MTTGTIGLSPIRSLAARRLPARQRAQATGRAANSEPGDEKYEETRSTFSEVTSNASRCSFTAALGCAEYMSAPSLVSSHELPPDNFKAYKRGEK